MPSPVAELLADLGAALLAAGTRWYLWRPGGTPARHGTARLTADVDITVDLSDDQLPDLIAILGRAGFTTRVPELEDSA